jgi:pimeloyl-ACP methyl ester carboxylesterase
MSHILEGKKTMFAQKKPLNFTRTRSDFMSQGVRCAADLYLPTAVDKPPIVIMAHGLGAERSFGLPPYAEYFANEGMAVFLFDYRCFGDSDGEPRQLVHPKHHVQDWQAAMQHVRSLSDLDTRRIALWGSSYSGGHVIVTAAKESDIGAIVSQIPAVDSFQYLRDMGLGFILKAIVHGIYDMLRMVIGLSSHDVPLVGKPKEFAVLNSPDAYDGYMLLVPEGSAWENKIPARLALTAPYRPITSAAKVTCPALVVIAEKDSITPASLQEKMADRMPKAEVVKYPIGHFDIYLGNEFEEAVATQAAFLKKHLLF